MSSVYPTKDIRLDYFKEYTAIVESLMNQGLTLQQLQGTVVGKTEWEHWRTAVKALGRIPNVITDIIFNNPLTPVRVNLVNPITGSSNVVVNTAVAFSVPAYYELPAGVTFNGWTVTPGTNGTNWQTASLNANPLQITFKSVGNFTLTAKFTLPGGMPYTVAKTIKVEPALRTPIIGPDVQHVKLRKTGNVYVRNVQADIIYEWEMNGAILRGERQGPIMRGENKYWLELPTVLPFPPGYKPNSTTTTRLFATIRCRACYNGDVSEWSNTASVYLIENNVAEW